MHFLMGREGRLWAWAKTRAVAKADGLGKVRNAGSGLQTTFPPGCARAMQALTERAPDRAAARRATRLR